MQQNIHERKFKNLKKTRKSFRKQVFISGLDRPPHGVTLSPASHRGLGPVPAHHRKGLGLPCPPRQGPAWVWQALLSRWHQGSVAERWLGWLRMSLSTPASQHFSFTARKTKCKHHKVQWKLPYYIYSFLTCIRFTVQWTRTRECKYFLIIWGKNKIKVNDVLCLSFLWRGQEFAFEGERFFLLLSL